ncbi:MAG: RagB/SusD family nutrient uptake outer membrane protein [Tannerella sp.]|nr:RagB/SusD family nutrient uptake outer membrane protein [Tannerella sp.]
MKTICKIITVMFLVSLGACDYLDVVPDNLATIDYAFRNRTESEKYLYTCYSYRPQVGDLNNDPAMSGGDETWPNYTGMGIGIYTGAYISYGFQTANNPYLNFWDGSVGGKALWRGIRDCNIFLENIDKVMDMEEYEKTRWIAEVKFLKAYYHYYLFKCYGPIPLMDVNLPISASVEEVKFYREPVDKVVEYISSLILEAVEHLPNPSEVIETTEAGRVDKLAALSIRAELLLFAASPLFNGNTDYKSMIDNRGEQLFNQTYDENKWKIAADACREVIDLCHERNKALYDQIDPMVSNAPKPLQLETMYRQIVCDPWNKELIWGNTNNDCDYLSSHAQTRTMRMDFANMQAVATSKWSPTLKLAESYYSSNGVPIEEDIQWQQNEWYAQRYTIRNEVSSGDEIYYVKEGQRTVYLHYNRERRFYASLGFDRGIYYGNGYNDFPDNVKHCEMFDGEYSGFVSNGMNTLTGYGAKKMHSFKNGFTATTAGAREYFPFPIMRLANLYLMYAEALNEFSGPGEEVYQYLDLIRARVGLEGVKESWRKYSNRPEKPDTKDGLREIIHRERTIELALEGKRFWDLRRWKQINEYNVQPRGWNIRGETAEDFYRVLEVALTPVKFSVRDYFFPIKESSLVVNRNLMQNYGW